MILERLIQKSVFRIALLLAEFVGLIVHTALEQRRLAASQVQENMLFGCPNPCDSEGLKPYKVS